MQFKEHENGQKSADPKIAKLDKLARLLNVKIHVDGIPYGKITESEDIVVIPEEPKKQLDTDVIQSNKPKRTYQRKKAVDNS